MPGTCGPHTVPGTGAGIGGVPEDTQMIVPAKMLEHPFHPQVFSLNFSSSLIVIPFEAAIPAQKSPPCTGYVAHDPSGLRFGLMSGTVPEEQQTC